MGRRKDGGGMGRPIFYPSVQFSHSVVYDSATPWISARQASCPSPTLAVHSDSHLSSQWCHPAISSSIVPFSSCPQSLPASESFPVSQLFAWGGQSTGVSASASFFPKNTQGWSPLEWTGWISLQSKGLSRVFPGYSDGKESTCNARDPRSISRSERTPGEGNRNPLQYSCLENPMDRGAWQATVHGVTELDTTENYSVLRPEIGMVSQLLADPLHLLWVLWTLPTPQYIVPVEKVSKNLLSVSSVSCQNPIWYIPPHSERI